MMRELLFVSAFVLVVLAVLLDAFRPADVQRVSSLRLPEMGVGFRCAPVRRGCDPDMLAGRRLTFYGRDDVWRGFELCRATPAGADVCVPFEQVFAR